jgi:dihydrofolate reductase
MPKLIHVVAFSADHIIGLDGKIPWRLKGDLGRFKKITAGSPMLMGRKTFDSLPGMLPGRAHVMLTRQDLPKTRQTYSVGKSKEVFEIHNTLDEALASPVLANAENVYVIGGGDIYRITHDQTEEFFFTYVPRRILPDAGGVDVASYPTKRNDNLVVLDSEEVHDVNGLSHVYINARRRRAGEQDFETYYEFIEHYAPKRAF